MRVAVSGAPPEALVIEVVTSLQRRNHEVLEFLQRPATVTNWFVTEMVGDTRDSIAIRLSLVDKDAVINVIGGGPWSRDHIKSSVAINLIDTRELIVKRRVALSSGVVASTNPVLDDLPEPTIVRRTLMQQAAFVSSALLRAALSRVEAGRLFIARRSWFAFIFIALVNAGSLSNANTTIVVSGRILGASGEYPVCVSLWDEVGFMRRPVKTLCLEAHSELRYRFEIIPSRWAISAFEDQNRNGILDIDWLGPTEPSGFRRAYHAHHKPRFDEVLEQLSRDTEGADIVLRWLDSGPNLGSKK